MDVQQPDTTTGRCDLCDSDSVLNMFQDMKLCYLCYLSRVEEQKVTLRERM